MLIQLGIRNCDPTRGKTEGKGGRANIVSMQGQNSVKMILFRYKVPKGGRWGG